MKKHAGFINSILNDIDIDWVEVSLRKEMDPDIRKAYYWMLSEFIFYRHIRSEDLYMRILLDKLMKRYK